MILIQGFRNIAVGAKEADTQWETNIAGYQWLSVSFFMAEHSSVKIEDRDISHPGCRSAWGAAF